MIKTFVLTIIFASFFSTNLIANSFTIENASERLLKNIAPVGTLPGIVVASPSKYSPNYWYHWVRDAALVMDVVFSLHKSTMDPIKKENYRKILFDYALRVKSHQETKTLTGYGEPKFHVDSSAFNEPWGRPQNDGPALRATTLIRFANLLLDEGQLDLVRSLFYDGKEHTTSIIKRDLDFVLKEWRKPNFDLWEEVLGTHFYTRMVQFDSLRMGSLLASRLGDNDSAIRYLEEANKIRKTLHYFYDDSGYIRVTINQRGGMHGKHSGLDSSVFLAVLHTKGQAEFSYHNPHILKTFYELVRVFNNIYSINRYKESEVAPSLGRYPEDYYYGGNPWVLTTFGAAEYLKKVVSSFEADGKIKVDSLTSSLYTWATGKSFADGTYNKGSKAYASIIAGLKRKTELFYKRVDLHKHPNGDLSEQIDRYNGFMISAPNLTWNYASLISSLLAK